MFKNFDITVDTTKEVRNQAITINTNDLQTIKFSISVTQLGEPVYLTDSTVRLAIKKPDEKTVCQDCTILDGGNGKCEIILEKQAYSVPGLYLVEVMIYYSADKISVTGKFSYTVNKGILEVGVLESTNEFQTNNQTITDVEGIVVDLRDNGKGIDAQARYALEGQALQLADLATKEDIDDIVISAKKIGLIANDSSKASQNTTLLNTYLATNTKTDILFLSKDYYFNNTITVTASNRLIGKSATRFFISSLTSDFIFIKPYASIEKLKLMLPTSYTGVGIVLKDNDYTQWNSTAYMHYIRDVFIRGDASTLTATGILLEAKVGYNISNFSCYNTTIMNCAVGVKVIGNEDNSTDGWANGIFFDNVFTQNCTRGIYNTGSGNRFIFSHQCTKLGEEAIYCGGRENTFIGMIWDAKDLQRIIYLSPESKSNFIVGKQLTPNIVQQHVLDLGADNILIGYKNSIPQVTGGYIYDNNGNYLNDNWADFYGSYSNVLNFMDKIGTVNLRLGASSIISGSVDSLFKGDGLTLANTTSASPIVIEIIFDSVIDYVPQFGITFRSGKHARGVKIEYATTIAGSYITSRDVTDNFKNNISVFTSSHGRGIGKLKFTLYDGLINSTLNPNREISIGSIFLYSRGRMGNYYLAKTGGDVYGDIVLSTGKGIIVKTPDGLNKYRIGVDNDGNIVATKL
ncbi:BppU family phage baseplate upper protein [Peribacillus sp. V2I11]|uniref:BppU family phage baseplate upper protein n=1 Tax=Peribacillus sp. V2I11 TaxID=3042277 RepID=UPI00278220F5|nr:BppU family phage baseplate upper protein [Peribacillus sp. V2I11]MDQ0882997.1 hypothetical protein [Peribacillus sp. V2I11]